MESELQIRGALDSLVESHRTLVEDVNVIRQHVDRIHKQQLWMKRRWPLVILGALLFAILVPAVMIGVMSLMTPTEQENPWEKQLRQQQQQSERADQLLIRSDALLRRWEKSSSKE